MHQLIPAVPPPPQKKMLKIAPLDCAINKKCCSIDGGQAFALFFHLHPGGFDSSAQESPPPGIRHPRQRINANARRSATGGWAQLELTDALQGEG